LKPKYPRGAEWRKWDLHVHTPNTKLDDRYVVFTAEMEGDKIGGFSESTMTPGKRALFALRLILDESEDTWPLLIDQPEDDLDSKGCKRSRSKRASLPCLGI